MHGWFSRRGWEKEKTAEKESKGVWEGGMDEERACSVGVKEWVVAELVLSASHFMNEGGLVTQAWRSGTHTHTHTHDGGGKRWGQDGRRQRQEKFGEHLQIGNRGQRWLSGCFDIERLLLYACTSYMCPLSSALHKRTHVPLSFKVFTLQLFIPGCTPCFSL